MSKSSTKREIEEKLDKPNEVAATTAAVAIEDLLGCIDVEGRSAFGMQRTHSDEFLVGANLPCRPVAAPQIFQQRDLFLQVLHAISHTLSFTRTWKILPAAAKERWNNATTDFASG
jgi:hypothetical protein